MKEGIKGRSEVKATRFINENQALRPLVVPLSIFVIISHNDESEEFAMYSLYVKKLYIFVGNITKNFRNSKITKFTGYQKHLN